MEATQQEVRRHHESGYAQSSFEGSVIVVGAGLAGLATALELVERGVEVTVLEARQRAGGRVLTLRAPFNDGMYAEAGAMTVTPYCSYVMDYTRRLGVGLDRADLLDTDFSYYFRSRFAKPGDVTSDAVGLDLAPHERNADVWALLDTYVGATIRELAPDITSEEWAPGDRLLEYDVRSVRDVLRAKGASSAAIDLLEPLFLEMRGGELEAASALSWLRHEASPHALARADDRWAKIEGGTEMLPLAMADRLRGCIRYSSPVVGVAQDDEGVRVDFLHHGKVEHQGADRVVLAVPFSVARHIELGAAELSDAKHRAIRQLRYSTIVRVYLQMRRQFWPGHNASWSTDLPIRWVRDATPHVDGPRKIIECLLTGARGRLVSAMSEEERIEFTLGQLETMLPGAREHFEHGVSVDWSRERYSEGAYILPEVGHQDLMPAIRRPEGRVHFAGEHAAFEPNGGAMTFALESAARVLVELGSARR